MTSEALRLEQLVKHYGDTEALKGIDVIIPQGQICALLGKNGAGKSTAIHCALGLAQPTEGSARVFGEVAGSLAARQRLGVMLQDADLPDNLTGREHLALFASYFNAPADIDALITETDIGEFCDQRYKKLSGGQKRRVQFAVALVGRPDILFLDEPTTGLDAQAREAVWRNIRTLATDGKTIVLTTHYLEEADVLADRICILHSGRVIADDDAAAIRTRVGGSMIRCETHVSTSEASALPSVREAGNHGRQLELLSDDAAVTLSALLARDPGLRDLTVTKPSLEEAFSALTINPEENPS
ncbi:MAG: ABC transporter ATP-binding protein [Pseudomonadota bacterium]